MLPLGQLRPDTEAVVDGKPIAQERTGSFSTAVLSPCSRARSSQTSSLPSAPMHGIPCRLERHGPVTGCPRTSCRAEPIEHASDVEAAALAVIPKQGLP